MTCPTCSGKGLVKDHPSRMPGWIKIAARKWRDPSGVVRCFDYGFKRVVFTCPVCKGENDESM